MPVAISSASASAAAALAGTGSSASWAMARTRMFCSTVRVTVASAVSPSKTAITSTMLPGSRLPPTALISVAWMAKARSPGFSTSARSSSSWIVDSASLMSVTCSPAWSGKRTGRPTAASTVS